jgi:type IV pilus assembly protein PilO
MANLRELRPKVRIATAVLATLCIVVLLYTDAGRQQQEFQVLHSQVQNSRGAMVPPQTVEDRVKEAREQIANFYEDRFPATDSSIFERMGKLANENHVHLNQASYRSKDSDMPGIEQVTITAGLSGDYAQVMKFINALERDKMFFIVDGVTLADQTAGTVHLSLGVETYMRGEQ